jgi:GT2 family glycosyltransferase
MRPTVTVIIVNWNGGALLQDCLFRLTKQSFPPSRIIVIDNASTDASDKYADQIAQVTLIKLNRNTGFAFANNRALEECNTDYVALLNPDAFAETDWLEQLIISAQTHPSIVAFGSRQLVHGKTEILDGIGDIYHMSGLVWRNGSGRSQTSADLVAREIFSPCAGAALYSREALQKVGGFDEDFFCYVEDVDLGFRLRLAGYKSIYVPEAVVYHVGSASTGGSHSDFSIYHGHRNLVWTFIKNMPGILLWTLMPLHLLLNIVSILYFSFRGKGKVILTAKFDAIKGISSMWSKRRHIQGNRQVSAGDIWHVLDKRMTPFR